MLEIADLPNLFVFFFRKQPKRTRPMSPIALKPSLQAQQYWKRLAPMAPVWHCVM